MDVRMMIIGGSGFLGYNLSRCFSKHKVLLTYLTSPIAEKLGKETEKVQLDVRNETAVYAVVEKFEPRVVIHAAGNKDIRYCERHPDEAHAVNAIGTRNVAKACRRIEAQMIYISTDLVFDCTRGRYKEDDIPHARSVYGKTKWLGEQMALSEHNAVAVCRSSGVYGKKSPLLRWVASELDLGKTVECFTDVFNTPTYAENLAEMIDVIMDRKLTGVFHTVGRERVNRFQYFLAYARLFGLKETLLTPTPVGPRREELLLQEDASLEGTGTARKLGITFNSVAEGLARLKADGGVE